MLSEVFSRESIGLTKKSNKVATRRKAAKTKKKDKNYIVEILWSDSFSHGIGWRDIQTREKIPEDAALIRTVGYLVSKSKKWVTICQSVSEDADGSSVYHTFSIPTACINKMKKL